VEHTSLQMPKSNLHTDQNNDMNFVNTKTWQLITWIKIILSFPNFLLIKLIGMSKIDCKCLPGVAHFLHM